MTKRFTLRAAAVGLAVTGLFTIAACGGDDDGSADTTERAATTTTEPSDSATTEPAGTDTTDGAGGVAADCLDLGQEFATALGGATNPTGDPEQIDEAFDRLEANVPDDLKDDVQLVGEALGKYADLYQEFVDDPTEAATDPDVLEALQELSAPEYQSATQAISAYFTSGCEAG